MCQPSCDSRWPKPKTLTEMVKPNNSNRTVTMVQVEAFSQMPSGCARFEAAAGKASASMAVLQCPSDVTPRVTIAPDSIAFLAGRYRQFQQAPQCGNNQSARQTLLNGLLPQSS